MNKQLKADFSFFLVTIVWGGTFLLAKMAVEDMPVYSFLALRFGIAFLVSAAVFYKRMIKMDRDVLKYGTILGVLMFFLYAFQMVALTMTTASKTAFIAGTNVVIVPIIMAVISRKLPQMKLVVSAVMALVGVGLLSLNGSIEAINTGDVLALAAAIVGAFQMIKTGEYTVKVDSVVMATIQFGVVSLLGLGVSLAVETPSLPSTTEVWLNLLVLGVVCTSAAFIVQSLAMKYTTATHAALIFSCVPVFAGVFGYVFLGEVLPGRGYVGALLILMSMIIMEAGPKRDKSEEGGKLDNESGIRPDKDVKSM